MSMLTCLLVQRRLRSRVVNKRRRGKKRSWLTAGEEEELVGGAATC